MQAERLHRHYLSPPPVKYPVQPRPSIGITGAERALARLSQGTFLSFWSYPNVVRDDPRSKGGVIPKEVADLIVVFEDDVLLFSDKDCAFPASGNLDLDWARWYRRAVQKSAAQLWGAERWIRQHPDRLFIDQKCTIKLPIPLPDPARMRVHRLLVAHGACDACRRELGGSGSLMIAPRIVGDAHTRSRNEGGMPFAVGRVDQSKPFVHILDDTSLELLLRTLDTVSDLVEYLRKKEKLITRGRLDFAAGEEALLGWYLTDINDLGKRDFVLPPGVSAPIAINEEWWYRYQNSGARRRKEAANRVSYVWDDLVELFTRHFMDGTSHYLTHTTGEEMERGLRWFARENRTRRRMLAGALVQMLQTTAADERRIRVLKPSRPGDPYWVLLLVPFLHDKPYEDYRAFRRGYAEICCQIVKLMYPDALDIVAFTTESARGAAGSEDYLHYDVREWTEADAAEAGRLQRDLEILVRPTHMAGTEYEYPPAPA